MTEPLSVPHRNWAAVLVFVCGAGAFVSTAMYWPFRDNSIVGSTLNVITLVFGYFPGVIGVLIAAFIFAFGTGRLASLVGRSRWGRVSVVAWALLNAASQLAFVGYITDDAASFERAQEVQVTLSIATILVGLVAAVFIARARVVASFGRAAMFVTVALFAVTEALLVAEPTDASGYWSLPRLLGLALLGIAFWRAGVPRPAPVPAMAENLAE